MSHPNQFTRVALTTEEREALMAARRDRVIGVAEALADARRWRKRPRRTKKLPLKVLAHILGVSHWTVSAWEAGRRRPSSEQLAAWWRALAP